MRELVPEFERRHPGVRLEVQQVPWTAAHEKLLTAHVGNATPDVAQLGNTWLAEFVALGALAPLDSAPRPARRRSIAATTSPAAGRRTCSTATPGGCPGTSTRGCCSTAPTWWPRTGAALAAAHLGAVAGGDGGDQESEGCTGGRRALRRAAAGRRVGQAGPAGLQAGAELLTDGGRRGGFRDPRFRRAHRLSTSTSSPPGWRRRSPTAASPTSISSSRRATSRWW